MVSGKPTGTRNNPRKRRPYKCHVKLIKQDTVNHGIAERYQRVDCTYSETVNELLNEGIHCRLTLDPQLLAFAPVAPDPAAGAAFVCGPIPSG